MITPFWHPAARDCASLRWEFIIQESKKTRKHAFDQKANKNKEEKIQALNHETDHEKKENDNGQEKVKENMLSTKKKRILVVFLFKSLFDKFPLKASLIQADRSILTTCRQGIPGLNFMKRTLSLP